MSGQTTKAKGSVKERIIRFKEDVVTWIVMGMLRPFNRHKMVNLDRVKQDPENPIVFLGNHAEISDPSPAPSVSRCRCGSGSSRR